MYSKEIIYKFLNKEINFLNNSIILYASASLPFKSVYNILKYPINFNPAEGSINKRFFANCDNINNIEEMTQNLALDFFNLNKNEYFACVQPYSGTQANHIIYNAILKNKKSTVLAMSPYAGGHVSHCDYIKKFYTLLEYGTDENGILDYNQIEKICIAKKVDLLIAGTTSYPRIINYKKLFEICKKTNTKLLADISHTVIYSSIMEEFSPFPYADFVTFTTNKTTRGIRGGIIIYKKKYEEKINYSCFPFTQGALKLNEILAKAMMFIEWMNIDRKQFMQKIISYTTYFVEFMKEKNINLFSGGSDMHYVTLFFPNDEYTGKQAENILSSIGVFTNANKIKIKNKTYEGLRIGFLMLACINFSMDDFYKLTQIIYDMLFTDTTHTKEEIVELISKYKVLDIYNNQKI